MTERTAGRTAADARVKGDAVPTVVQQRHVPEAIRSLSTLETPDYVDVFTVAGAVTDKSPEQWAVPRSRACPLGHASSSGGDSAACVSSRGRRRTTWPGGRSPIAATAGSGWRRAHGS